MKDFNIEWSELLRGFVLTADNDSAEEVSILREEFKLNLRYIELHK